MKYKEIVVNILQPTAVMSSAVAPRATAGAIAESFPAPLPLSFSRSSSIGSNPLLSGNVSSSRSETESSERESGEVRSSDDKIQPFRSGFRKSVRSMVQNLNAPIEDMPRPSICDDVTSATNIIFKKAIVRIPDGSIEDEGMGATIMRGKRSIFLMLNAILGSGILNLPEVFAVSGVLGGILSLFLCAVFCWLGLVLIVECGVEFKTLDYGGVLKLGFPQHGERISDIVMVMDAVGSVISNMIFIGGSLAVVFRSWGCDVEACNVYFMTCFSVFAIAFPISLLRSYGNLYYVSILSMFSVTCIVCLVLFIGPLEGNDSSPPIFHASMWIKKFGSVLFSLTCAPATFHAYNAMERTSKAEWRITAGAAYAIAGFLLLVVGLAGALSFGDETDGVILQNFSDNYADPFRLLSSAQLLLCTPRYFIVARHSLVRLLGRDGGYLPIIPHVGITLLFMILLVMVALLLRFSGLSIGVAFGLVLDIAGGTTSSVLCLILPAAMYLKLMSNTAPYRVHAMLTLIFGILMFLLVPIFSIAFY